MRTITTEDLMLSAAYIVKGFFEHVIRDKLEATELIECSGEVHVVYWLTQLANDVEAAWAESEKEPAGVWCYEVAEPLGRFIANGVNVHGEFPSVHDARQAAYKYAWEALEEDA